MSLSPASHLAPRKVPLDRGFAPLDRGTRVIGHERPGLGVSPVKGQCRQPVLLSELADQADVDVEVTLSAHHKASARSWATVSNARSISAGVPVPATQRRERCRAARQY